MFFICIVIDFSKQEQKTTDKQYCFLLFNIEKKWFKTEDLIYVQKHSMPRMRK